MIQQNSLKKNDFDAKRENSSLDRSKCYLVKGAKPLLKYRFYLDVKNYTITNKLEQKIKDLGGVVEFFLVREVSHVISDRDVSFTNGANISPISLNASIESNYDSPRPSTSTPRAGVSKLKTRADAMLDRVRSQTVATVTDPLRNAKLWGIPIWTVNKVFSWLEKISANISFSRSTPKAKAKSSQVREFPLKAPYIKFEPESRDARPVHKSLESWPVIDLEGPTGGCAFRMKPRQDDNDSEAKMTRRSRPRLSVRSMKESDEKPLSQERIQNGYCEICHLEYRELSEHLRSDVHQQFVKNDSNYLTLDSLIGTTGNVEAFLRLNGGTICRDGLRRSLRNGRSPNGKFNGDDDRPMTRGRSYNTRLSGAHSALSPTGSESGHHLRSRSNLYIPGSLLGTTAEDEVCPNKPKEGARQERKNSRLSEDDNKSNRASEKDEKSKERDDKRFPEHGKGKKTCMKTKRISADERLVNDNRTYYKVEVMTTKLRSSGLGSREHEFSTTKPNSHSPIPEEEHHSQEQSLVVKFKKIRRSELATLNDEAENFMFPRKEDSSFDDLDTDEGPNTTCSPQKDHTMEILSSEFEKSPKYKDECSEDSEEFLDNIVLKERFKKELDEKKLKKTEEDIGKRRSRRVIDYHEENSESDTNIKIRPRKNISYLEESSVDEEIVSPKKEPVLNIEESSENSNQKRSRKNPLNTYRVTRPYKRKYIKKSEVISLDDTADSNAINIIKSKFKNSIRIKRPYTKRKYTKKSAVMAENLDDTAQDGSVLGEITSRRKRKSEITLFHDDDAATSRDSVSLCDSVSRGRKKRSHAEVFIEENQKYFKFDSPGSRLRYQGSIFGTIKSPPRMNGEQEIEIHKERPEFSLADIKYSFEVEPKSEPWFQTFTRQDRGEEHYTSLSDPDYHMRIILPYQLPATLAPLDPQVCISHYDRIKDYIINPVEEEIKVEIPEEIKPEPEITQSTSEAPTVTVIPPNPPPKLDFHQRRRKKKRFNMKVNLPRKSPRKHASTLAILSSFINNRKKRERKSAGESDLSKTSLGQITEEESPVKADISCEEKILHEKKLSEDKILCEEKLLLEKSLSEEKLLREKRLSEEKILREKRLSEDKLLREELLRNEEIVQNITALQCLSEILSTPIELDISEEIDGIMLKDKPDAIELIENYESYKGKELHTPGLNTTRTIRRKRKKNRTGWPKKKRLFPRKVGLKNEDVVPEEETQLTDDNDEGKASDEESSDLENRTIGEIDKNADSVDSNCNVSENKSVCVEQELTSETATNLAKINSETSEINTESQPNDEYHVDLNTWENAEKVLHAKMVDNELIKSNKVLQPVVRVRKLDGTFARGRLRSSSSPDRKPKAKRPRLSQPISPRSPRKLRAPRGKWYRER